MQNGLNIWSITHWQVGILDLIIASQLLAKNLF